MTESFDVFLSHNSKDKPAVRELAEALRFRGFKVWLDEWELVPGRPWQEALEEVIETTKSSVVLVGKDGLGPWQDKEMRGCLAEFVERNLPVIPVLLPGAPDVPKLPIFLKGLTWVDLRRGLTEEGIDRLQWGITGKRPIAPGLRFGSSWAQMTDPNDYSTIATPPPLPPPPAIAPDGSSALLPPTPHIDVQAAPVSAHMTRPSRRGPLAVPGRTIFAASVAAFLPLAVAATLFGRLWWTAPRVGRDAQEDARQKQVVELVRTGSRSLRAGDPATAATAFRQAEQIAPDKQKPPLRNVWMEAERQAQMFGQLVGREKIVVEHLLLAQQAMENRRFQEAVAAADAALALDPNNSRAQQIRADAQKEQTRVEQARRQRTQRPVREEVASTPPAPEPEPLPPTVVAAEEPVPVTARLDISFQSDMMGVATVRVHVNSQNIFQKTVGEKGGFMRKRKGGRVDASRVVEAGDAKIEVWVTAPGGAEKSFSSQGNFPGGSSRSLKIRISADGEASVDLLPASG